MSAEINPLLLEIINQILALVVDPGIRRKAYLEIEQDLVRDIHQAKNKDFYFISAAVRDPAFRKSFYPKIGINIADASYYIDCGCPSLDDICQHAFNVLYKLAGWRSETDPIADNSLNEKPNKILKKYLDKLNEHYVSEGEKAQFVVYVLDNNHGKPSVQVGLSKLLKNGKVSAPKKCLTQSYYHGARSGMEYFSKDDLKITAMLDIHDEQNNFSASKGHYDLTGFAFEGIVEMMVKTGRCFWQSVKKAPLHLAKPREVKLAWQLYADGTQSLEYDCDKEQLVILSIEPNFCIDLKKNEIAQLLDSHFKPEIAAFLTTLPKVLPTQIKAFNESLKAVHPDLGEHLPKPTLFEKIERSDLQPEATLEIVYKEKLSHIHDKTKGFYFGKCVFKYGDQIFNPGDNIQQWSVAKEKVIIYMKRNFGAEERLLNSLKKHKKEIPYADLDKRARKYQINSYWERHDDEALYFIAKENDLNKIQIFNDDVRPALEKDGWQIETDLPQFYTESDFIEIDDWYSELHEDSEYDWFNFEMGVTVAGEKINILPQLIEFIQHGPVEEDVYLQLQANSKRIKIPAERITAIANNVINLLDLSRVNKKGHLKLSRYQASLLAEIKNAFKATELRWVGRSDLLELGKKILDYDKPKKATVPKKFFQASLRPYQQKGVNWLQFLRENQLAGILADEMGLGKTLQTIANLVIEIQSGRADKPILIIAPTSVVFNWKKEFERFAPEIKTLVLQGQARKKYFSEIESAEIILTSYALLLRDKTILLEQAFYYLVLDEAHYIKNRQAKVTQIVQQIQAKHRLSLTGTPLENHLGELWSQFNFLMPGLLGSYQKFRTRFQVPIEKEQDRDRNKMLTKLTQPFFLRRTKNEVVLDLPPKSEIIKSVNFSEEELDVYQSIRMAMDKKVREAVQANGIERSHLLVLDALLKLRQVCCDARLLKKASHNIRTCGSKLNFLIDMVGPLIESGRRIIIFSQFTEMLQLIEDALKEHQYDYAKLTGSTTNREKPINAFQSGEVPIFLISLKAGGVGLNLTTADTIIHYDPWWNPAVEQQATDRAHRIGQDKSVFVYKLIVENSVEEKILQMQEKKRNLADALYNNAQKSSRLTEADLQYLLSE